MRPGENRGAWKECLALLPPGPDAVHTLPPPRPSDGNRSTRGRTDRKYWSEPTTCRMVRGTERLGCKVPKGGGTGNRHQICGWAGRLDHRRRLRPSILRASCLFLRTTWMTHGGRSLGRNAFRQLRTAKDRLSCSEEHPSNEGSFPVGVFKFVNWKNRTQRKRQTQGEAFVGIGSPWLLRQLVRRTAVGVLVALVFAPSAFADDGVLGSSTTVGPVTVSTSVGGASEPAVQAAASPSPALATPVAKPPAQPDRAVSAGGATVTVGSAGTPSIQAAVGTGAAPQPQRSRSPLTSPQSRMPRREATDVAKRFDGRRNLSRVASSNERGRAPALPRSPWTQTPGTASLSAQRASTPAPLRLGTPQFPAPKSPTPGFGVSGAGASGIGATLLRVALAAGLAALGIPGLGRRISPLLAAPRPHPYLLQLERPD